MGTQTYTLIAETTTTTAANVITFSNIPATYEDLVFEFTGTLVSGGSVDLPILLNGQYATNYSYTKLSGNGSAAASSRASNQYTMVIGSASGANISTTTAHIMSYSNPNVFKTVVSRSSDSAAVASAHVGLWRQTSVVTSVGTFLGTNAAAGTVVRLYGLVA